MPHAAAAGRQQHQDSVPVAPAAQDAVPVIAAAEGSVRQRCGQSCSKAAELGQCSRAGSDAAGRIAPAMTAVAVSAVYLLL